MRLIHVGSGVGQDGTDAYRSAARVIFTVGKVKLRAFGVKLFRNCRERVLIWKRIRSGNASLACK